MNSPPRNGSLELDPPGASALLAAWRTRFLGGLLFGVAVAFAAGGAHAAPLITGCCDSLTDPGSNGYLPLIQDVYDPYAALGVVDDFAYSARTSYGSYYGDYDPSGAWRDGLAAYLGDPGVDPEVVVVLSGTPDPFWDSDGDRGATPPDPNETVNNVEQMVLATRLDGGMPIVVAPPPVDPYFEDNCPQPAYSGLNCQEIRTYVASMRNSYGVRNGGLEEVASYHNVPYVDLYTLFGDYLPYQDLYVSAGYPTPGGDGVHPNDDGDLLIAEAVLDELVTLGWGPCNDGFDNDGDGTIDFGWDIGCDSADDLSERTDPDVIGCDDGIDNDGDGTADFHVNPDLRDPGCGHPLQMTENPACNDGIDNDGDGLIDFDGGLSALGYVLAAPDPHCSLGSITREAAGGCGLGFEVSLLLAPLMWWRRRRASRR